jgi:hypothetical protein
VTAVLPTLIPVRQIENPLPHLTHNQQEAERTAAALDEANRIVREQLAGVLPRTAGSDYDPGKLAVAISRAVLAAEERGQDEPREIPTMFEVFDYPDWAPRPPDPADGGVIDLDDYDPPRHGLQCPHCGAVAWDGQDDGIYVIDRGERWNRFGYVIRIVDEWSPGYYEPDPDQPDRKQYVDGHWTGRKVEQRAVVGGYGGGADMEGVGYACETCSRRVNLPDGVEEVGD